MAEDRRLSIPEIVTGLRKAGFSEDIIPTMAAIAGGESSFRTGAYNPRGADDSFGLLQINMEGPLGPARRQQYGLKSNEDLFDPATNFRVAKGIYDSQGLSAWGAYTDGGYKKFVPQVTAAMSRMAPGSSVQEPASSPPAKSKQPKTVKPAEVSGKTAPRQTRVVQDPRAALKDSIKQNLFRNLMGSVIQDTLRPPEIEQESSDAAIYREAANKLLGSDDPYDQQLALKYEQKAIEAMFPT